MSTISLSQHHSALGKLEAHIAELHEVLAEGRDLLRGSHVLRGHALQDWMERTERLLPIELR